MFSHFPLSQSWAHVEGRSGGGTEHSVSSEHEHAPAPVHRQGGIDKGGSTVRDNQARPDGVSKYRMSFTLCQLTVNGRQHNLKNLALAGILSHCLALVIECINPIEVFTVALFHILISSTNRDLCTILLRRCHFMTPIPAPTTIREEKRSFST